MNGIQMIMAASTTTALGGLSIMSVWAPVAARLTSRRRKG
jgi:hypothetical protein